MRAPLPSPRARRGSSLIEVLISLAIMAIVMVGVLQMFSVALVVNKGAAARTHMQFRCQQVVENLRFCYHLARTVGIAAMPAGTGILPPTLLPFALTPGTYNLPYDSSDATFAYWGPTGANVMETENGPYKLSYTIYQQAVGDDQRNAGMWIIRVTAVPTDETSSQQYFRIGPGTKRIDYVAEF